MLFADDHRDIVKTENPELKYVSKDKNVKTISTVISEMYKNLSKEEKDKYEEKFKKGQEEYKAQK